jgi:hypothetical protein
LANDPQIDLPPPITVQAGEIQFVEACHPALVAGEYRVSTVEQISSLQDAEYQWKSDSYKSEVVFSVDAPRFTLNPADIHSVYPPANETGRFDNALPHVVFTRRTLPWERTLDGNPPQLGKPFLPWMGLLLFQEDELQSKSSANEVKEIEVKSLPILSDSEDSLLHSRVKDVLAPDVGQHGPNNTQDKPVWSPSWEQEEKYRYEGKSCLTIDLPADLFKTVAPRDQDLLYLAHVRQVDTGDKEVLGINDRGWFSLIMGNRAPQPNKRHRAFLVSLEGFQDRLTERWSPATGQKVRLAVLGAWAFICEGASDFKTRMHHLNGVKSEIEDLPESGLRLRFDDFVKDIYENNGANNDNLPLTAGDANDIVNAAYARGYTAFDYFMRQGEQTVSWYRGPLVPVNYAKPRQIQKPVSCTDELLRYDPETGLFDSTYAAAWQLGRLLALQNQAFALSLDRARRTLRTNAEMLLRQGQLERLRVELGLPDRATGQPDKKLAFLEDSFMEYFCNGLGDHLVSGTPSGTGNQPAPAQAKATINEVKVEELTKDYEVPDDITSWLGRLVLLYGVPFQYLIPEEEMLPPECIRFFYLDPIWIQCLVQGACSVGNSGYVDTIIDQAMNFVVQPYRSATEKPFTGRAVAGVRDKLREQYEGVSAPNAEDLEWPLTGFLLRSAVVQGYRGLEFKAYTAPENNDPLKKDVPLKALRIEQLSPDILLGVFNGSMTKLVVREPQESLHFGLRRNQANEYVKSLRGMGFKDGSPAGQVISQKIELGPGKLMRNPDQAPGVIKIAALAEQMKTELNVAGELKPPNHFTSAEFAVEMIEAAGEFTFIPFSKSGA